MSDSKTAVKRQLCIPLRLRITILFTLLLVAVTGILTAFSIMNNTKALSAVPLEKLVVSVVPLNDLPASSGVVVENHKENSIDLEPESAVTAPTEQRSIPATELEQMTMTMVALKQEFRNDQLGFLLLTIALGAAVVYWLVGRALRPLTSLSGRIAEIDACRLGEKLPESATGDELASLVQSFNSMLTRLEQSFAVQKQFSANAAHELKTPLATMKTSLQVLALDQQPTLEEYRENAGLMARRVDHLIEIVQNLLLLASQECSLQDKISLRELIEECLGGLEQQIHARRITLHMQIGDYVLYGDRSLLLTAVRNVLSNSIKYNREGGLIEVCTKENPHGLVLTISDNGDGVSPQELPHLFEPFYRADTSCSGIEGNGLGLAIVESIIEKHGGSATVRNHPKEGLEVLLLLPPSAFEAEKTEA